MRRFSTPILLALTVLLNLGSPAQAQSDQTLVDRYDSLYEAGKYELALKAAETICQRYPDSALWHFNAGALNARLDHPDEAISHLRLAADNGYTGVSSFEQNSDLDPVRERDDFKAILESVREAARERMGEFQREAKRHQPKIYCPPVDEAKHPLVIALHGTGMDGQSMYDALVKTCTELGAILIAPDGIRASGSGFAWTYRDESEWYVNTLIDEAIESKNADPQRVVLVGFSQGANIALIMGQNQPERFAGVIPICGHYEPQVADSEIAPAPFYLVTGARDPWKKTYTQAKSAFESRGGAAQLRVLSARGHELPVGAGGDREYAKAIAWCLAQEQD